MIATDRIYGIQRCSSRILQGQVLNQIASADATADIVPNWKQASPDPMVTAGVLRTYKVEMVIRGYIIRFMNTSRGAQCISSLPEDSVRITTIDHPTTKADEGHDENISKEEIIAQGLVSRVV